MKTRLVAAVAVLVSAVVHLRLWLDGFRDLDVVGPAFMLNAVAGIVITALLLLWRHWLTLLLALGFGVATLGAFVISTTVGLFGVHEHWVGFYVWAAAVSEAVAIVAGVLGLWRDGHLSRGRFQHRLAGDSPDLR
ncbi:MAG: hypothetical protein ACRDO8_13690 [Nocardioidaceae bacterium]